MEFAVSTAFDMLSKKNRFHGHDSLRYVFKNGRTARAGIMTVKTVVNPRRRHSRFAVVVSKKVIKSATGRNRIRRRLYELLRQDMPKIKSPHDTVVIVTSSEVRDMPFPDLQRTLTQLLNEAGLYN